MRIPSISRSRNSRSNSSDDDHLDNNHSAPSLSKLFSDAEGYEKAIAECGSPGRYSTKAYGCVAGFADLIASDLDVSEKAVTNRLAQLSVTGDDWTSGDVVTSEPESYDIDTEDSPISPEELETDTSRQDKEFKPVVARSSTIDGERWKLEPEDIVDLLVQEFGSLASEDEEEKLIIEADAALFNDIAILGVLHLTTHRLAFHATLLATRPDLSPRQQIIKAGPAIIHRKGWRHKKRRVWLELSHDMMSTYSSSSDEDHIRPMRTVLYSHIRGVLPMDKNRPRFLELKFGDEIPQLNGLAEFDTEESANDWRKELQGALFLYKHSRRQALGGQATDDDTKGVRLSIPLNRIDHVDVTHNLGFTLLATLHVPITLDEIQGFNPAGDDKETTTVIQFATMRPDNAWKHLSNHVDVAKARSSDTSADVIIDFGPLNFLENDERGHKSGTYDIEKLKETEVRKALALDEEDDIWIARARIRCSMSSTGYFAISDHFVGFWSKTFGHSTVRYRLPISMIKEVKPTKLHKAFRVGGLVLEIEGQNDLEFYFKAGLRDQAVDTIKGLLQAPATPTPSDWSRPRLVKSPTSMSTLSSDSTDLSLEAKGPVSPSTFPVRSVTGIISPLSRTLATVTTTNIPQDLLSKLPKTINVPRETLVLSDPKHFVCLTIGSRGDVQPYIALGLGLQKEGHSVTIVTHEEYKEWVESFGICHRSAGGDPGALMRLSVENKMFSPEFFRESLTNFRSWLDELLVDAWEQCQGADVLLESPSAMAGVHIAEALNIPYFRCFTMPWTKTAMFPHAFLSPPVDSPTFNSASYVLFDNVMWTATSGQINRWRKNTMNIGSTDMGHLAQSKITFIYNFSPAVVPKPLDWGDTTVVSGYWFLDNPDPDWAPPESLLTWMAKAKEDKKPIVYIGFGSITVPNASQVTERIVKAVLKSGVRAIISKGWSSRMSKENERQVQYPPECYPLDKVPHDWLFPQIDAALHHGGAGTTGASLRAGIPTLIKPWFGDQFFWASRVQKLGAGLRVPSLRVNDLAEALTKATTSRIMKEKAALVGDKIRQEDGVHTAIHAIFTYLPRAGRDRSSLH